jgi:hypothetical protein
LRNPKIFVFGIQNPDSFLRQAQDRHLLFIWILLCGFARDEFAGKVKPEEEKREG